MNLSKLGSYWRSEHVPAWRKILGAAGLVYILSPLDFVPDVIPVLGWLDDIGVAAMLVAFVRRELKNFAESELQESQR